jgi:hypothetical protein
LHPNRGIAFENADDNYNYDADDEEE